MSEPGNGHEHEQQHRADEPAPDPTAPTWPDPVPPIWPDPTPPGGGFAAPGGYSTDPGGDHAAAGASSPDGTSGRPAQEPLADPYALPEQPLPYGQPAQTAGPGPTAAPYQAYGQQPPPYGTPDQAYGAPDRSYPAYGQPYGAPGQPYPAYGAQPGFPTGKPYGAVSGRATAVLVLGIAAIPLLCCLFAGIVPAVVALALAPSARREIRRSGGALTGEGQVKGGQVTAIVALVLAVLGIIGLAIAVNAGVFDTTTPGDGTF